MQLTEWEMAAHSPGRSLGECPGSASSAPA